MVNLIALKRWFMTQQWVLWVTAGMTIILGLSTLYSLFYNSPEIRIFYHQLTYIFLGLIIAFVIGHQDYRIFKKLIGYLFAVTLGFMVFVLIGGVEIRGTTGWIDFKFFNFQPVELAKLTTIVALSLFFAKYHNLVYSFKVLLVSFLIPLPFAVLTYMQPDMGSTLALLGIWLGFILASNLSFYRKIAIVLVGVAIASSGWFFFLKDYQKARLSTFLHPETDARGVGYNTLQSITAIGSGGFLGKGLGYGSQSQLNFLPEAHSDFIFAVFAEEAGWVGSLIFLFISGFFLFSVISTASISRDNFGYFLSIGIFWFFLIHFLVNMGMNLGIMPVIGLPLPFLSAGGTNLFISFTLLGILQSIAKFGIRKI